MSRKLLVITAVCAGIAVLLAATTILVAQEKTEKKVAPAQYTGRVTVFSKPSQTITIQGKTGLVQIKYTDKTKFTYRNKPATIDAVKEGLRVIVLVDPTAKEMVATRIDVREEKQ